MGLRGGFSNLPAWGSLAGGLAEESIGFSAGFSNFPFPGLGAKGGGWGMGFRGGFSNLPLCGSLAGLFGAASIGLSGGFSNFPLPPGFEAAGSAGWGTGFRTGLGSFSAVGWDGGWEGTCFNHGGSLVGRSDCDWPGWIGCEVGWGLGFEASPAGGGGGSFGTGFCTVGFGASWGTGSCTAGFGSSSGTGFCTVGFGASWGIGSCNTGFGSILAGASGPGFTSSGGLDGVFVIRYGWPPGIRIVTSPPLKFIRNFLRTRNSVNSRIPSGVLLITISTCSPGGISIGSSADPISPQIPWQTSIAPWVSATIVPASSVLITVPSTTSTA